MSLIRVKVAVHVLGQKKPVLRLDLDETTLGRFNEVVALVSSLMQRR